MNCSVLNHVYWIEYRYLTVNDMLFCVYDDDWCCRIKFLTLLTLLMAWFHMLDIETRILYVWSNWMVTCPILPQGHVAERNRLVNSHWWKCRAKYSHGVKAKDSLRWLWYPWMTPRSDSVNLDCMVYGAYMGPTWGRQDPGRPHDGPMNLAIWECMGPHEKVILLDSHRPSRWKTLSILRLLSEWFGHRGQACFCHTEHNKWL